MVVPVGMRIYVPDAIVKNLKKSQFIQINIKKLLFYQKHILQKTSYRIAEGVLFGNAEHVLFPMQPWFDNI